MSSLNRRQFRQTRLFAPLGMTKQPHQMTPLEFANSPRTMIHGSDVEDVEEIRSASSRKGETGLGGFHAGSPASASDRLRDRTMSAVEGYYHPLRVERSEFVNTPDDPGPDKLDASGWANTPRPSFYRNRIEDEGSISAIYDSPRDVKHYADYVHDALDRGGIPSATAEHFATRLDSEENQYSPGIPRGYVDIRRDEIPQEKRSTTLPGQIRSRIEHREDLHLSPSERFHQSMMARNPEAYNNQDSLFTTARTYTDDGWPKGEILVPSPRALPDEAAHAQARKEADERQRPWLERMEREDQGAGTPWKQKARHHGQEGA
jgi:hypothetical protein